MVTHEPRFRLKVAALEEKPSHSLPPFHKESPAGRLFEKHRSHLKQFSFQFQDPHLGQGGFGASGAQFLMLFAAIKQIEGQGLLVSELYQTFKELDSSGSSGADILAQWMGGLCLVQTGAPFQVDRVKWPFEDDKMFVVPTGMKLSTHEHLKSLKKENFSALVEASRRGVEALDPDKKELFFDQLHQFVQHLRAQNLVAPHSEALLQSLKQGPGVRFVKPCGALGSDTLLVIVEKKRVSDWQDFLAHQNRHGFSIDDRAFGLRVEKAYD